MTQAQTDLQNQNDLQNQLEQATADFTTRPLLNDSPVLYIDTSEPTPTNSLEQMEQDKIEHDTSKVPTLLSDTDSDLILHSHLITFTVSIPITPSDTETYLPSDDPNITDLMVSHVDCAKQHNL